MADITIFTMRCLSL